MNRGGYSPTAAQLQVVIKRCAASGKVTRRLDCDGAGYPLPIANIDCSRDAENVTPNKGPPAYDAERVFESDSSFSCFAMQPQTKGVKSAKKTKNPKRASGGCRPAKSLADSTNMNAFRNAKISLALKKKELQQVWRSAWCAT
jgi:hypothetical protein